MTYDYDKVKEATKMLLEGIGEDMTRDGIKETPDRVAKMYGKIMDGYDENPINYVKLFDCDSNDMVVVRNVPFYSYCEHHLQPFYGKLTIAYIPDGKVLGLSKLVRIARVFAKRPQIQEKLTNDIAKFIEKYVPNKGVAVSIRAEHMCMHIRGVRSPGSETVTTHLTGMFKTNDATRDEFLRNVSDGGGYN